MIKYLSVYSKKVYVVLTLESYWLATEYDFSKNIQIEKTLALSES